MFLKSLCKLAFCCTHAKAALSEEFKNNHSIDHLQELILDRALRVFSILALLATLILGFRYWLFGEAATFWVVLVVDLIFIAIIRFSKHIHYKPIANLLVFIILLVLAAGLWRLGLLAAAIFYMSLIPIFAYLTGNYKRAIISIFLAALIYATFGLMHINGWLNVNIDVESYIRNPVSWILNLGIVGLTSVAILDIVHHYRKNLVQSYQEMANHNSDLKATVEQKTADLRHLNTNLESANQELKQKLVELKSAQNQLIEKEKLASLGLLTAGIAHEIKNPLNYISSAQLLLKSKLEEENALDEELKELLEFIATGSEQMNRIIKGLNQFSRNQDTFDENCQIDEIITSCLQMINHLLKNRIEVRTNYPAEIPIIRGNVGKLHQVFMNLLSNSAQAIEKEGAITISIDVQEKQLGISISDTGGGISEENLERILEPFFTTKEPGLGTGLGLSISRSIIEEHQGDFKFESVLGEGTTVFVDLPYTPHH